MKHPYERAPWAPENATKEEFLYDKNRAQKVITFIKRYCTQVDGRSQGQPITILPWELVKIKKLFGTVKWSDQWQDYVRQYAMDFTGIGKKNGKTTFLAMIVNYFLAVESEKESQQIVIVALDKAQARILYEAAMKMVLQSKALSQIIKVKESTYELVHKGNRSWVKVVAADDPKKLYGLNPTIVVMDELVAQKSDRIYLALRDGQVSKAESLFLIITTAGFINESEFAYSYWLDAREVQKDQSKNKTWLVDIWEMPTNADFKNRSLWGLGNPSLGQTKFMDKMEELYAEGLKKPNALSKFRAFHLNQWVSGAESWIEAHIWKESGGYLNNQVCEKQLEGRKCYGGLDMSKGGDFSSWALVFPGSPTDEHAEGWTVLVRSWVSEASVDARKDFLQEKIHEWAARNDKQVTICPGTEVRFKEIEEQIIADCKYFNVLEIGADPNKAEYMSQNLEDVDIEIIPIRQIFSRLSEPTLELQEAVTAKRFWHGNSEALAWMLGNVVLDRSTSGEIKPSKAPGKKKGSIDGIAAIVNALFVAMQFREVYVSPQVYSLEW